MEHAPKSKFNDAEIVEDVAAMLARVSEKSGEQGSEDPEHVSEERLAAAEEMIEMPTLTPEQASELAAVLDSLELKAARANINPPAEKAPEVVTSADTSNTVGSVSPYAPPEALGIDTRTVKESEVLYPGADPMLHKKVDEAEAIARMKKASDPFGFGEMTK